ncbi:MAG: Jag N-terminal domain-containing protein [Oscillibacter sp.]|nr:Jag N-terminal domain-containing protein [Oscillibacter sp.]
MRDYIDITGKTEEEAIRKGLEQLRLDRDDVSIEILERAKAGFLGFGSAPAKIRMSYGPDRPEPTPEPEAVPEPPKSAEEDKPVQERRERRRKKPAEVAETDAETPEVPRRKQKPKSQKAVQEAKPPKAVQEPKPKPAKQKPVQEAKPPKQKPVQEPKSKPVQLESPVSTEEVNDEKAAAIRAFLSGLLEHMDTTAEIRVYQPEEGRYKVILEGAGMGALIGRRGETLDAIQQLTNYSVNRSGARVRIQLDAEGYREKREQSLQNLARKEAAKVVKYRRSRTLEPMNAYERHVIHTALQDFSGVNTYSTGVDPNRRVVIAFDREST